MNLKVGIKDFLLILLQDLHLKKFLLGLKSKVSRNLILIVEHHLNIMVILGECAQEIMVLIYYVINTLLDILKSKVSKSLIILL